MTMFREASIATLLAKVQARTLDPMDVARECIARYERLEPTYRAWVCFDPQRLVEAAEATRLRVRSGLPLRPLEGIPVGVKDIFNTTDFPTQMGSPLWRGFTPGNDARVVYYLKNAGGAIAGKTVTAEFAVHTLNDTENPHDRSLTPGTSSSGSAVAVALGMVPVTIGTQTAGSIVRPASFCGVYGCKPSFGLIPRTGILKTTDSLDSIGYYVARPEDLQRVFELIRVHGPNFPVSDRALSDVSRQTKPGNRPWKVAVVRTHTWEHAPDYAKRALLDFASRLAVAGIEIREPELPAQIAQSHAIHETIYNKTLSYYFAEEYKKAELVSPIMNELIETGNGISVESYHQALRAQEETIRVMDVFASQYDAIVSLSTSGEAPPRHDLERPDPALIWTLTQLPVVSVPACVSPSGMPFGIQMAARKYNDKLLFGLLDDLRTQGLVPEGAHPPLAV